MKSSFINLSWPALFWGALALGLSCSPVNTTSSTPTDKKDTIPSTGDASSKFMSQRPPVESTLSLPSWCKIAPNDSLICFHCTRTDAGVSLAYEQCLAPAQSFDSTKDCWFTDELNKKIKCLGTASGKTFVMDVSTAREKVTESLPALLFGLNLAVSSKFNANSDAVKFTQDISMFFSSRIQQIMRREDLQGVAGDLRMLVNSHIPGGLTDTQAAAFTKISAEAFDQLVSELSGKKDYDLANVILRLIQLKGALPRGVIDDTRDLLTGSNVAELLSSNNAVAFEEFFRALSPGVAGVSSPEQFLANLRQDD